MLSMIRKSKRGEMMLSKEKGWREAVNGKDETK
jgi:hypothetical protein